jgi:hypothetical protein
MAEPGLFDHDEILAALNDLAGALTEEDFAQPGASVDLIVVGGAYLALRELRVSTDDIDTVTRLGKELTQVIEEVAGRHGLARDWLNDHAAPYKPDGLTIEQCELVFDRKPLRVYLPPEATIFLMKLAAARNDPTEQDRSDMIALWPRCGFQSPAEAVQRFFDAYPVEVEDPYLEKYVAEIARIAGS